MELFNHVDFDSIALVANPGVGIISLAPNNTIAILIDMLCFPEPWLICYPIHIISEAKLGICFCFMVLLRIFFAFSWYKNFHGSLHPLWSGS